MFGCEITRKCLGWLRVRSQGADGRSSVTTARGRATPVVCSVYRNPRAHTLLALVVPMVSRWLALHPAIARRAATAIYAFVYIDDHLLEGAQSRQCGSGHVSSSQMVGGRRAT